MPLIASVLENELRKIFDQEHPEFTRFPADNIQVGSRWSNALDKYAAAIVPVVLPAAAEGAKKACAATFLGLSASNGIAILNAALTAYTAALSLGMQPAFTGTPPAIPINLVPIFAIGMSGGSSADVAKALAETIDLWFKTGISVNNASGVTANWL